MRPNASGQSWLASRHAKLVAALILFLIVAWYFTNLSKNPPGFHIDESSVSYNAYTIAQTGHDEHGVRFPLFFRAFGEYKNPIYIYLLAGVFRITGPSIVVARCLSVVLMLAAALGFGVLAWRLSGRTEVTWIILVSVLLTPWLFELSRVVLEVSLYPLAVVLLLLSVQRVGNKFYWSWFDATIIAFSLALLTYTYSIGRLFAPLLALGLLFFLSRVRWTSFARVYLVYCLLLLPMGVFHWQHPGALMKRFYAVTITRQGFSSRLIVWDFIKHYLVNINPWRMVVRGDPNHYQIVAIFGLGQVLAATFVLALLGLFVIVRRYRRDAWWRFVVYGFAVSVVPASLTTDYFHILRLAPLPPFILLLCVPALEWLFEHRSTRAWRLALTAAVVLILAQGLVFQIQYHVYGQGSWHRHLFDADYASKILATSLAQGPRPIYLADTAPIPIYIQAYWYGTLQRIPLENFKHLALDEAVPADSVAITTEEIRPRCQTLARVDPYIVCLMRGAPEPPRPLKEMRAELTLLQIPPNLRPGQKILVRMLVKNVSNETWFARERADGPLQVHVGNHWLNSAGGEVVNDDGRGALLRNLAPGQQDQLQFSINAPLTADDYLLEFDMVQEGVSWFAQRGSRTLRVPVSIR